MVIVPLGLIFPGASCQPVAHARIISVRINMLPMQSYSTLSALRSCCMLG